MPLPRTPEVVAEEARIVALLEGQADSGSTTCAVRILGIEGQSTYAWTTCMSVGASGDTSGTSVPIRVDGSTVRGPSDGGGYADSVRALFPDRVADAVLDDQERMKPEQPG